MPPFASDRQRKFLFANKPDVARKFAEHTPPNASLPERVSKRKKNPVKHVGMIRPRGRR